MLEIELMGILEEILVELGVENQKTEKSDRFFDEDDHE